MRAHVWLDSGFVGVRLGRYYVKFRDLSRHPKYFSERNAIRYRRLLSFRTWELGVRSDARAVDIR